MKTIYINESSPSEKVSKKEENKSTKSAVGSDNKYSLFTNTFLEDYESFLHKRGGAVEQKVNVSEVFSKLAHAYERIRTTIEYKGEHVLRRNAIERMLKRLVWEQESVRSNIETERIAETLLKELIWARYLPNNSIPQYYVKKVEKVINKYLYLLSNLDNVPDGESLTKVRNWIWGVASSELEDLLDPSNRDLYVNLMFEWFKAYFEWKDNDIPEHEKDIQIYLAIHRAYPRSDEAIMRYHLLLREYPDWDDANDREINEFILKFPKIFREIEDHLNYPGRLVLYRNIQKHAAAFEIFHSIAREEKLGLRNLLSSRDKFDESIRKISESKYKDIKKRIGTGILRSIIYIFVTKVIFVLILEVPYEIFKHGDVKYLPLTVNIVFPPLMMWFMGFTIKTPGAKNTEAIRSRLHSVVYRNENINKNIFSVNKSKSRSPLLSIFSILYTVLFLVVFGGITYFLNKLQFSIFGIVFFFVFVSLVLLFAFRLRYNANRLKVDQDKQSIFGHIFGFITLPFLNLGFLLSQGFSRFNFLTIIFDFLIEAPLKSILEIIEEWTSFVKEKREEVVEIPE